MADQFLTNLYDGEGLYVGDVLTDIDLSQAADRGYIIERGTKFYKWEQRFAQWRESLGVIITTDLPG